MGYRLGPPGLSGVRSSRGQALAVKRSQAIAEQGRSDALVEKLWPDGDKGQVKMVFVVRMIGGGTLVESRDPVGVIRSEDRLIEFAQPWVILMMCRHGQPQGGARPIFGRIYLAVFQRHVNNGAEKLRMQPFPGLVIRE